METRSSNITPEPAASPGATERWQPSWRTRWSLGAKKWFPLFSQLATVIISLAALFVIIKQALIYDQQRELMSQTQRAMDEQTSIIRVSQRSYVGVASITADLNERQIILAFENVGRIPADNIEVEIWESRRKAGENSLGSITRVKQKRLFSGSLKMEVVIPLDKLQVADISDIAARREKLYVIGKIEYEDGFGRQETEFAFEYGPPPNERWIARSDLITKK